MRLPDYCAWLSCGVVVCVLQLASAVGSLGYNMADCQLHNNSCMATDAHIP